MWLGAVRWRVLSVRIACSGCRQGDHGNSLAVLLNLRTPRAAHVQEAEDRAAEVALAAKQLAAVITIQSAFRGFQVGHVVRWQGRGILEKISYAHMQ